MQTIPYASLTFSVLVAFEDVMGKQLLDSYKAAWRWGSLKERGRQMQRRFDGWNISNSREF